MNSLITGGNGSCAHYLAKEIVAQGNPVPYTLSRPFCDLLDYATVCERIDAMRPDVIFHLAADADVRGSFDHPQKTFINNTHSTVNLFAACMRAGIKPVIMICSTSEVYGNPASYPITEDFPTDRQTNPYAISKKAQELIAHYYQDCYGFPVVITRAFGYINPRRRNLSLTSFAHQIVDIEEGKRQSITHGNLASVRSFCDVRDIVRGYLEASNLGYGTFNIGSEEGSSIKENLATLCSYAQAEIITTQDEALMRPLDVTNIIPDCSKFRKATGWEPTIPLTESLQWLLSTCRASA